MMGEWIDAIARLSVFYLLNGIWMGVLTAIIVAVLSRLCVPASLLHRLLWVAVIGVVIMPLFLLSPGQYEAANESDATIPPTRVLDADFSSETLQSQIATPVGTRSISGSFSWPIAVWILWLVVATAMIGRIAIGYWQMIRLKRSGKWGGKNLQTQFEQCKRRWIGSVDIGLRVSDTVASPAVLGIFRQIVLIPQHLIPQLSAHDLEQILKHEIAHVQRKDALGILVQRLVEVFLWCNPGIWWLSRQLSLTREMACDDYAAHYGHNTRDYALCLTRLTEMIGKARPIGLGIINRHPSLVKRFEYLLSRRRPSLSHSAIWLATFIFACIIAVKIGPLIDVPGRAEAHLKISRWSKPLADVLIGNPLPRGIGLTSKIVVVADETTREALRPVLEDLLLDPILTPQPEYVFDLVYVSPEAFRDFRAYRNLILVSSANGILAPELQPLLRGHSKNETVIHRDVWASDQIVVAVMAADDQDVAEQVALNGDRIVSAIDASMAKWLEAILYHAGENIEQSEALSRRFGWRMRVPVGYEVMDEYASENFVALTRQVDRRQLWLWVYWEDGVHPDQLTPDWCLQKWDDVSSRFYGGDQTSLGEVSIYQTAFLGKLTVCLEGLWENTRAWQGGPFKSYALFDATQNRFFLLNMGIYAPNRTKALQMRQLDVLAHTLSPAGLRKGG